MICSVYPDQRQKWPNLSFSVASLAWSGNPNSTFLTFDCRSSTYIFNELTIILLPSLHHLLDDFLVTNPITWQLRLLFVQTERLFSFIKVSLSVKKLFQYRHAPQISWHYTWHHECPCMVEKLSYIREITQSLSSAETKTQNSNSLS